MAGEHASGEIPWRNGQEGRARCRKAVLPEGSASRVMSCACCARAAGITLDPATSIIRTVATGGMARADIVLGDGMAVLPWASASCADGPGTVVAREVR
jgi:hypothetical protein